MYVKVPVEDRFYVWVKDGKKKNKNKKCIISAHGGQSIINSTFKVKQNQKFVFYAPHGYTLKDPSIVPILTGRAKSNQTISSGKCPDYQLSKYQGSHSDNFETYQSIEQASWSKQQWVEFGIEPHLVGDVVTSPHMDVVTIRNRHGRTEPSLHELVAVLKDYGWGYEEYHCSFCRGPRLPWKKEKGTWNSLSESTV